MTAAATSRLAALRPLSWVLPALLAFTAVDHGVDAVFGMHVTDEAARKGRTQQHDIEATDARILVFGDSSARYGVDTNLITEATGIPAWNLGSFLGGFPGHVTLLVEQLQRGREIDAVIVLSTEQLSDSQMTRARPAMRQFYASPTGVRLWVRHHGFDLDEVLGFAVGWLSPTFRAGQRLQRWEQSLLQEPSLEKVWARLERERRQTARWYERYREMRGQTHPLDGTRRHDVERDAKHLERLLFARRRPWEMDPGMDGWYRTLLEECSKHGVVVVHAFAPRTDRFLKHRNWQRSYGDPIRAWGEATARRYEGFVLAYPDGFRVDDGELYNTQSHMMPATAEVFTAGILELLAPRLEVELPAEVRALAEQARAHGRLSLSDPRE